MKRILIILTALLSLTGTATAMSYEQAREQALFLTDKMAYELNLTEEQYDAAYEINLDYLMSVTTPDDLYDIYWRQRNLDLSYVLLDWQYRAFCAATYFYRPLYWHGGVWHFAVYSHYPRRDYFYFGRTNIYINYRGGHSWRHNGGHSWYKGRTFHHGHSGKWHGLRDRFDRGDFHHKNHGGPKPKGDRNHRFGSDNNRHNANFGNRPQSGRQQWRHNMNGRRDGVRIKRESSTRTTARPGKSGVGSKTMTVKRPAPGTQTRKPSNIFTPKTLKNRPSVKRNIGTRKSVNSGGSRGSSHRSTSKNGGRGGNFGGKR